MINGKSSIAASYEAIEEIANIYARRQLPAKETTHLE